MTDAATDLRLEVTRTLPFPREKVFDAWLDAKMLAKFMIPGQGMCVPTAETDPREGGRFKILMQTQDGTDIPHGGTYKRIARADQIVFTWESPFSADDSTVTLDFEPEGDATKLTLTHIRFVDEEQRDNHNAGWSRIVATLNEVLAT